MAYMYALPYEYYEKFGIRRYGFHGTSHKFVSQRCADFMGDKIDKLKIITCHLGNGSSIAAVKYGKVIDTSMGFTPVDGFYDGHPFRRSRSFCCYFPSGKVGSFSETDRRNSE